jgi:hypothetical protein
MAKSDGRFKSTQALANIAKILGLMADGAPVSTTCVSAVLGLRVDSVADYLRYMGRTGLAHCSQRAVTYQSGSHPACWLIGPEPAIAPKKAACTMPRKVYFRKEWGGPVPAMYEPMAYLYGRMNNT